MGDRTFYALLNGLARQDYYGDKEITDSFLKSELYQDLSEENFVSLLKKCRGIIKSMATLDMDVNQLEAFLTSQQRKKEGSITEDEAKALAKFWRSHKTRIHEGLVSQATWNKQVKAMSWRIDVKAKVNSEDQPHNPVAIVEMNIGSSSEKDSETVKFEVDESSMKKVLQSLHTIDKKLSEYS